MQVHAHTPRCASSPHPEALAAHLAAVAATAGAFGAAFGWGAVAGLAGRLHDIGKCSAEFQAYLLGQGASGGDHSGAGAIEAACFYGEGERTPFAPVGALRDRLDAHLDALAGGAPPRSRAGAGGTGEFGRRRQSRQRPAPS